MVRNILCFFEVELDCDALQSRLNDKQRPSPHGCFCHVFRGLGKAVAWPARRPGSREKKTHTKKNENEKKKCLNNFFSQRKTEIANTSHSLLLICCFSFLSKFSLFSKIGRKLKKRRNEKTHKQKAEEKKHMLQRMIHNAQAAGPTPELMSWRSAHRCHKRRNRVLCVCRCAATPLSAYSASVTGNYGHYTCRYTCRIIIMSLHVNSIHNSSFEMFSFGQFLDSF